MKCPHCGKEFIPNISRHQKYCSSKCQKASKRKKYIISQKCIICGKSFIPNNRYRKYCSDECKEQRYSQLHKCNPCEWSLPRIREYYGLSSEPKEIKNPLQDKINEYRNCGVSYGYVVAYLEQGREDLLQAAILNNRRKNNYQ